MLLVSACLIGVNCKYNGKNNLNKKVMKLCSEETLIPVCPEQLGGCPTPRVPSEIADGDGADVLDGKSRVMNKNGEDVTEYFIKGAQEVLKIAKTMGIKKAILKARSPSCGFGSIYDGTFSGKTKRGNGVTSEILVRNGVSVLTEEDILTKEDI
ncbi:MAG TPA: DUF523 domain-containing protein [Hungateiclostridium thermocellum]|uniref:DUF523 domain-containing protein n=1 Tax=Acetivibrio thermocellus TaxID=1515 RepID=UPI0001C14653|nr:DUF523 domain-containing protein [Acetivibrio thermocellus]NLU25647.1 DUF523 domain-containing protein [Acetivibrio thermocellus]THJ78375.1 DUF523 domain-containing protein [Acetivibrio thermocellus]UWV48470.1 DUF523 domain-containing protein [Acetivibrio thermocellus]HBW27967.1 DUF523 domain-containing protein [Acetivibrio thermocellus]HOP93596.1 DUF523 domain-containing protein [Acetivibrio thermocellus]